MFNDNLNKLGFPENLLTKIDDSLKQTRVFDSEQLDSNNIVVSYAGEEKGIFIENNVVLSKFIHTNVEHRTMLISMDNLNVISAKLQGYNFL